MSNLNWNVFNSIAQDSGYQNKAKQKEAELEYVTRMEQRAEKRAVEQAASAEKVSQEMDVLNKMIDGLENPDVDRVKSVEQDARKIIAEGVKAANGDMKAFLLSGGHTKIKKYKDAVMQSDVLKAAQKNATYMKMIRQDWQDGKIHDRVNINGQAVTMQEAVMMFQKGEIDNIPYTTAYKRPTFNPNEYRKLWNPNNPYETSMVDADTVVDHIVQKEGVSRDIAMQTIEGMIVQDPRTGRAVVKNTWWGVKDGDNWKSDGRQLANANKNSGSGKAPKWSKSDLLYLTNNVVSKDFKQVNWNTADGLENVKLATLRMSAGAMKEIAANNLGLGINADGSYNGTIRNTVGFTSLMTGKSFKLDGHAYEVMSLGEGATMLQSYKQGKDGKPVVDANGKPIADKNQMYIGAKVFMTEEAYENMRDKQDFGDKDIGGIVNEYNENGLEGYTIDIGVPIYTDPNDIDPLAYDILNQMNVGEMADFYRDKQQYTTSPFGTRVNVNDPKLSGQQAAFNQVYNILRSDPNNSMKPDSELQKEAERRLIGRYGKSIQ